MDSKEKIKNELTCSQCLEVQETLNEIVYSQGNKVCSKCKEINNAIDKIAFDRDMKFR